MAEIYTKKEYQYLEEKLGPKLCKLFAKTNAFCAGGAITSIFANQPIHDFDIFFRDEDSFSQAFRYFKVLEKVQDNKTKEVATTSRAVTFTRLTHRAHVEKMKEDAYGPSFTVKWNNESMAIQLINPAFLKGSPEEVFMGFDFTICMGAYLFKEGKFEFDKAFLKDLARRELVFNVNATNVVSSLFRALKYKSRGFSMNMAEEMKLAMCLGSKKFKTFGDFAKTFGSVGNDETMRHLYNHIRYPTEETADEKASLIPQPYSVETVIDWLQELQGDSAYIPKNSTEVSYENQKSSVEYTEKVSGDLIADAILNSDLSESAIKGISDRINSEIKAYYNDSPF